MTGIGVILFLNSHTAELTIQSIINDSPASKADIEIDDVILIIDEKPTNEMGLKEAIKLIKGSKGEPIKLVLGRNNDKGKRKGIEINLIRDAFVIPEREFFNYDFPRRLQPMIPKRDYSSRSNN